jgi:hypothetical protein
MNIKNHFLPFLGLGMMVFTACNNYQKSDLQAGIITMNVTAVLKSFRTLNRKPGPDLC